MVNQDIRMDELVVKAREKQPGLIVVDQAVHGKNQNYLTPENRVPEKTLPYPWESCIISGGGWAHTPNSKYMSGREDICMTRNKEGNVFLFYLAGEGEETIPSEIVVSSLTPKKGAKIKMLGSRTNLKWNPMDKGFKIMVPEKIRKNPASKYAWVFEVSEVKN